MSGPVTEIALLPLKPNLDLSSGPIAESWKSILSAIASQPGFKKGYWGKQIEHADTVQLVIDWESLEAHQALMSSPAYEPFMQILGEHILAGVPTLFHIKQLDISSPENPLHAPITECVNSFFTPDFPQQQYASQFATFGEKAANISDLEIKGMTAGWALERLPHEGEEGGERAVFNMFFGWPSVESHHKFRETEDFKGVIGLLREGPKEMEVWHVAFERFE